MFRDTLLDTLLLTKLSFPTLAPNPMTTPSFLYPSTNSTTVFRKDDSSLAAGPVKAF